MGQQGSRRNRQALQGERPKAEEEVLVDLHEGDEHVAALSRLRDEFIGDALGCAQDSLLGLQDCHIEGHCLRHEVTPGLLLIDAPGCTSAKQACKEEKKRTSKRTSSWQLIAENKKMSGLQSGDMRHWRLLTESIGLCRQQVQECKTNQRIGNRLTLALE